MKKSQLFAAFLPLLVFWAVEEFWGLKAALIVGCITAVLEIAWEKFVRKHVSFLTLASNGLVLGLGGVSFLMDSGIAFKIQPMVMELAMAFFMIGLRFKTSEPFMLRMFREAPALDPVKRDQLLALPGFTGRLRSMDNTFIGFLTVHGLAVGAAAIWGSTRQWILLKGVLFYVLMLVVFLPFMRRPRKV